MARILIADQPSKNNGRSIIESRVHVSAPSPEIARKGFELVEVIGFGTPWGS